MQNRTIANSVIFCILYIIMHSLNFEGLESGTGKSGSGKRIGGNCKTVSILKPLIKGINKEGYNFSLLELNNCKYYI